MSHGTLRNRCCGEISVSLGFGFLLCRIHDDHGGHGCAAGGFGIADAHDEEQSCKGDCADNVHGGDFFDLRTGCLPIGGFCCPVTISAELDPIVQTAFGLGRSGLKCRKHLLKRLL